MAKVFAALGCVLALIAFFIHDRQMAERSATGQPWAKPTQPLLMLVIATMLFTVRAKVAYRETRSAIGAVAEKPDLFGRLVIFVGLAEGIAIYGLIVSILILNRLT